MSVSCSILRGTASHSGSSVSVLAIRLLSRFVSLPGLRAEFPVFETVAYLNAGTDGPLPAGRDRGGPSPSSSASFADGRTAAHFERRHRAVESLRAAYARALGCEPGEVALTTCTTEGMAHVIGGLELGPGDEVLASDEEHPGLLGALSAARELRGVTVREVPLARVAEEAGPSTRLVACSHVGWVSGSLAPPSSASSTSRSCSTAPRAWGRSISTWAPSAATHTRAPARSGCAAPTVPACSTSPRSCASG